MPQTLRWIVKFLAQFGHSLTWAIPPEAHIVMKTAAVRFHSDFMATQNFASRGSKWFPATVRFDFFHAQPQPHRMPKLFARHLLMLAVFFGLASQGMARETTPCWEMAQVEMTAMHGMAGMGDMPGCAEMQHAGKGKMPHKELSLCCFAMANCPAGIATDAEPMVGAAILPPLLAATWPAMQVLHGRDIAPDPDPPSYPG